MQHIGVCETFVDNGQPFTHQTVNKHKYPYKYRRIEISKNLNQSIIQRSCQTGYKLKQRINQSYMYVEQRMEYHNNDQRNKPVEN